MSREQHPIDYRVSIFERCERCLTKQLTITTVMDLERLPGLADPSPLAVYVVPALAVQCIPETALPNRTAQQSLFHRAFVQVLVR